MKTSVLVGHVMKNVHMNKDTHSNTLYTSINKDTHYIHIYKQRYTLQHTTYTYINKNKPTHYANLLTKIHTPTHYKHL